MTTQTFTRWGGLVSILAAVLLFAGSILRYTGNPLVGQSLYFPAFAVLVFAYIALYAAQAERAGTLGLVGFVLAALGAALSLIPAFLILAGAAGVKEAHAMLMVAFAQIPVLPIGQYAYILGAVLFGVATMRAGLFPRWTGLLLIVGTVLAWMGDFVLILWPLGNLIGDFGLAWMGWLLWSGQRKAIMVAEPKPAI